MSNVLGTPMANPIPVPGENGMFFTKSASRSNLSLFVEHSIYLQRFTASAGMMANWNSQLGTKWNFFPGFDLSYQIADVIKWYSSINSSLRMPTFTDLYYSSPTNKGNPLLQPEKAVEYESGLKYQLKWVDGHLSYFHRSGRNMIDWVRKPEDNIWYARNITELNTDGVEFSAKINPGRLLDRNVFIQSINLSWSYLTQNKQSGAYSSSYVLDYLKHKINLGISHKMIRNMGINWQFAYQERNGKYPLWDGSKFGDLVGYQPFVLVDGRIYWKKKGTTCYLEASNILNKRYHDFGNIQEPGRWIKIGIIHQLNL